MRNTLIGAAVLVVVIGISVAAYLHFFPISVKTAENMPASAAGTTTNAFRFEIATTAEKQELGLGNRAQIPDNYGMLFVFDKSDRYGFWMKDMLTSIDIIWLSADGDVLLIDHSVEPSTYPHVFYPPAPIRYVLETRAGYARDHNWDVGSHIDLPAPYGS